mgnify:CR=1 FL=1
MHVLRILACGAPCIIFILVVAQGRWRETLCGSVPLRAANRSHNATYCDLFIGLNRSHATYSLLNTAGHERDLVCVGPAVLTTDPFSWISKSARCARSRLPNGIAEHGVDAVSYTHLTLPTKA